MSHGTNLGAIVRRAAVVDLDDGTHPEVKALTLADWATIEEAAMQAAKRAWLINQRDNADLLPDGETIQSLRNAVTQIEAACQQHIQQDSARPTTALTILKAGLATIALAFDLDSLTVSSLPMNFMQAWLGTLRGEITAAWLGLRACEPGLTFDMVSERYSTRPMHVRAIANKVVEISLPQLKNADAPQPAAAAGQNQNSAQPASSEPPLKAEIA